MGSTLSLVEKEARLENQSPGCDVELIKTENWALKHEVSQLKKIVFDQKERIFELEKEHVKDKTVWELCPGHQMDSKAFACSEQPERNPSGS